jgi:hypothetical protein
MTGVVQVSPGEEEGEIREKLGRDGGPNNMTMFFLGM